MREMHDRGSSLSLSFVLITMFRNPHCLTSNICSWIGFGCRRRHVQPQHPPPRFRVSWFSSELGSDSNIRYVHRATLEWVQTYTVKHNLCPFANKSDYQVSVWPGLPGNVDESSYIRDFVAEQVQELNSLPKDRKLNK